MRFIIAGGDETCDDPWKATVQYQKSESKKQSVNNEVLIDALPWGRMVGLHGGNESVALKVRDGAYWFTMGAI